MGVKFNESLAMDGKSKKGSTAGVYVDLVKFSKLVKQFDGSRQEFAETIGRSDSWVFNVLNRGTMAKVDALALKAIYKVDLVIDKPAEKKEDTKQATDNTEVIKKIDEMIVVINRLGNVNMQILEEIHKLNKELNVPAKLTAKVASVK